MIHSVSNNSQQEEESPKRKHKKKGKKGRRRRSSEDERPTTPPPAPEETPEVQGVILENGDVSGAPKEYYAPDADVLIVSSYEQALLTAHHFLSAFLRKCSSELISNLPGFVAAFSVISLSFYQ